MAQITHLPANCSIQEIIEVIEEQGAAIVDDFVSQSWLEKFNTSIEPHIQGYQAIDHEEDFANDFFWEANCSPNWPSTQSTLLYRSYDG